MKRGPYILGHFFSGLTLLIIIQNAEIFYRRWKYWHSPVLHGKGLTVVMTDVMCLECGEGAHNDKWKIGTPITFFLEFCGWLSEQRLQHKQRWRARMHAALSNYLDQHQSAITVNIAKNSSYSISSAAL